MILVAFLISAADPKDRIGYLSKVSKHGGLVLTGLTGKIQVET